MFISRHRYNELQARADMYAENARDARKVQRAALDNAAKIAEKFVDADDRTNTVEKQLDEAKAAIADRDRRIERLQARLDDALGLNTPGVLSGARWQERRSDRPRPVKP